MICPKCDGEIDALIASPWGTGSMPPDGLTIAPFICSACASLLLLDFEPGRLFLVPPEGLEVIKRNQVLWKTITDSQRRILALPNRRPVLR